jgi:hypothetical protein
MRDWTDGVSLGMGLSFRVPQPLAFFVKGARFPIPPDQAP